MIDSGTIKQQVQPEKLKMASTTAIQQNSSTSISNSAATISTTSTTATLSPPSNGSDRYEKLKAAREKALGSVAGGTASAMVLAVLDESNQNSTKPTEATPLVGFSSSKDAGSLQDKQDAHASSSNPCEFIGQSCTLM